MRSIASWGSADQPFRLEERAPVPFSDSDKDLARYTGPHLGFHGYLRVIDRYVQDTAIVGVMDLPDRNWRDLYDRRIHPIDAAGDALECEGFARTPAA